MVSKMDNCIKVVAGLAFVVGAALAIYYREPWARFGDSVWEEIAGCKPSRFSRKINVVVNVTFAAVFFLAGLYMMVHGIVRLLIACLS